MTSAALPTPPDAPSTPTPLTRPVLTVVSGPPGSGKTTLAHALARELGCPAVCRDEVKEGLVRTVLRDDPGYRPSVGDDPLNPPANTAFFGALEALLRGRVAVVAEAAFQDRLWRMGLEPVLPLAELRIVRLATAVDVRRERILRRLADSPTRAAHGDSVAAGAVAVDGFVHLDLDVPVLEVDTSDGLRPALEQIAEFAGG